MITTARGAQACACRGPRMLNCVPYELIQATKHASQSHIYVIHIQSISCVSVTNQSGHGHAAPLCLDRARNRARVVWTNGSGKMKKGEGGIAILTGPVPAAALTALNFARKCDERLSWVLHNNKLKLGSGLIGLTY
jgi:hypothetical protein